MERYMNTKYLIGAVLFWLSSASNSAIWNYDVGGAIRTSSWATEPKTGYDTQVDYTLNFINRTDILPTAATLIYNMTFTPDHIGYNLTLIDGQLFDDITNTLTNGFNDSISRRWDYGLGDTGAWVNRGNSLSESDFLFSNNHTDFSGVNISKIEFIITDLYSTITTGTIYDDFQTIRLEASLSIYGDGELTSPPPPNPIPVPPSLFLFLSGLFGLASFIKKHNN